jgi:hypothetical protein
MSVATNKRMNDPGFLSKWNWWGGRAARAETLPVGPAERVGRDGFRKVAEATAQPQQSR